MSIFTSKGLKPTLSFEFFPPKEESLLPGVKSQITELALLRPDYMTVTYGAGGGTRNLSQELVRFIHEDLKFPVCPHLTCSGHSKDELAQTLSEYAEMGLTSVLALRGDPPKGEEKFKAHDEGYTCARDFVKEIKKTTNLNVAVAGYPEVHNEANSRKHDLNYLKEKVDAGAEIIITQLFFDESVYFEFVEDAQKMGIKVPIIPGILPISNYSQLARFTKLCGATIPNRLVTKLENLSSDPEGTIQFGIEEATRLCSSLLKGGAPGIHLYTLNKTVQIVPIVEALTFFAETRAFKESM